MATPLDSAVTALLTLAPDGEVNQFDHLTFVVGSQEFFGIDDGVEAYRDDAPEGATPISNAVMADMDFD